MAFIAFMGDDLEGRLDLKRIYFDCSSMLGLSLEERDNYSGSFLHKYFEMNYLLENADYTGFEIDGKCHRIPGDAIEPQAVVYRRLLSRFRAGRGINLNQDFGKVTLANPAIPAGIGDGIVGAQVLVRYRPGRSVIGGDVRKAAGAVGAEEIRAVEPAFRGVVERIERGVEAAGQAGEALRSPVAGKDGETGRRIEVGADRSHATDDTVEKIDRVLDPVDHALDRARVAIDGIDPL